MEIKLKSTVEVITQKLQNLNTIEDVADILEVPTDFLKKILYGIKERQNYRSFTIQKKSKKLRLINAPPKNLSILQKKLNIILNLLYRPKKSVHGFVKKRSIVTNASLHRNKRHVLNIDLKDFFPSIHLGRIRGVLMSPPFNIGKKAAIVIAQICTLADGSLPQGAPTSPIISNLICRTLDRQLTALAKKYKCNYSRYADDITISTNQKYFPDQIAKSVEDPIRLGKELLNIIQGNKFEINTDKIRYYPLHSHQSVTGLTVNEIININRQFIRSVSAALYAWNKYGYDNANRIYKNRYFGNQGKGVHLKTVLRGRLDYIKMVRGENDYLFRKMSKEFARLNGSNISLPNLSDLKPCQYRGGYTKYQVWNMWHKKYQSSIVFIEIKYDGQTYQGTGFHIGNGIVATAGHNLKQGEITVYINDTIIGIKNRFYNQDALKGDVGVIIVDKKEFPDNTWIPTQRRLPENGEEIAAIGYPTLPQRNSTIVLHTGYIEALPVNFSQSLRYLQVSFQSGGGLSGAPVIDRRGYVVGIMSENVFLGTDAQVPSRPYGQAVPIEYFSDYLSTCSING